MSLINKMLRDLAARQVQAGVAQLPNQVQAPAAGRAVRRVGRGTWIFVALAVVAYALLQVSDYWLPAAWNLFQAATPPSAVVAVPVPAKAPDKLAVAEAPGLPAAAGDLARANPSPPPVTPDLGGDALPAAAAPPPAPVQQAAMAATPVRKKSDASQRPAPAPKRAQSVSAPAPATETGRTAAAAKPAPQAAEVPPTIEKDVAPGEKIEQEFRKAVNAYQQGRTSEAAAQFKAILRESPRHLGARQTLLSMYAEQRQWEEAQNLLKEGLIILPTHIDWAMALARIQAENGQTEEAWFTLQRHAVYAEERAEYQGFAGVLLQRLRRSSEAAARFRAAARLKPGEGRWWLGLGTALEADGHATEAREAFLRARASEGLTADMSAFLDRKLR